MRNSYHGRSFSTIAITGNRSWSPTSLSPFQTYYVHGGQQYRSPFAGLRDGEFIAACVADLRDVLDQAGGDVAAFIAEPIQGVGGFTSGPTACSARSREVLREHGILWISDEVQTGWGRTGEHFWGWQAHGATPDLVTFAKGVGNGLSMGGVIAPASDHGFARRQLDLDVRRLPADRRRGRWPTCATCSTTACRTTPRGRGRSCFEGLRRDRQPACRRRARQGFDDRRGARPPDGDPAPDIANMVLEGTKRRGVLIGKGGLHGNVLRIAPPLSLTRAEAEEGLAALVAAIEEVP